MPAGVTQPPRGVLALLVLIPCTLGDISDGGVAFYGMWLWRCVLLAASNLWVEWRCVLVAASNLWVEWRCVLVAASNLWVECIADSDSSPIS